MPAEASLARIIREFGDRWVIEHMPGAVRWVAVRRDDDDARIIGAHDIGGLRFGIEAAERDDTGAGDER